MTDVCSAPTEHVLPTVYSVSKNDLPLGPRNPPLDCIHCCEPATTPFPVPHRETPSLKIEVYPFVACGPSCSLAFLQSTPCYKTVVRISLVYTMCQWLGLGQPIPSPPRVRLKRFGGPLSIEEFRAEIMVGIETRCIDERLVTVQMVAEHTLNKQAPAVHLLPAPTEALLHKLVQRSNKKTASVQRQAAPTGSLGKLIKPKKQAT